MKGIHIGFDIGDAKPVSIGQAHLIVTGVTQLSGKTTTLEALIKRSGLKAIVFKTKIGEKSFTEGTETAPFFRDRSDYEFVKSLIEAYAKEKLFLEKGTLMRLSKETSGTGLIGLKKRVDEIIAEGKLRGIKEEIYTRLQHYLENIIPQIQYSNLSKVLNVYEGINIMNLERFSEEAQSLIIEATVTEVLNTMKGVIIVVPEAWKFIPQKYNNPCKRAVEAFIRQGAANQNFLWIDSQDMAGVDKIPLKQVSTWILGYQKERNEVKHTLDQIPLPKNKKPSEDEIQTLKIGQFYVSTYDFVKKVYVQPSWMDEETAISIAKGEKTTEDVKKPDSLIPYNRPPQTKEADPIIQQMAGTEELYFKIKNELVEIRQDFFNKIQEVMSFQQKLQEEIYKVSQNIPSFDESELISKVLQKMPSNSFSLSDRSKIVEEVLSKLPKGGGGNTYTVAPLEKIKKDFLEQAKNVILGSISTLDAEQQTMLKYIETQAKGQKLGTIIEKCLFKSQTSGGTRDSTLKKLKVMAEMELISYDSSHSLFYPCLKETIVKYCGQHGASEQEIEQVYNHVLGGLL